MRLAVVALCAACAAWGEGVDALVRAVREAIAAKWTDAEIAAVVAATKVDERVENAVIEQLEFEGAGPRTIEQLEWLREATSSLAPAAGLKWAGEAALPTDEQARMIERARAAALEYSAKLPNFLCTETVRRHGQNKQKQWTVNDVLTIDVAYSEQGERYKLLAMNGQATTKPLRSVGGFRSNGEFGSLLKFIYQPKSDARFQWERWSHVRGRRVAVFSYQIEQRNSTYRVDGGRSMFSHPHVVTGAVGLVYVDPDTRQTLRFTAGDDGLPGNFPIRETWMVMDYDYAEVGGQPYLLPKRMDLRAVFRETRGRSIVEFGNYRRFSSEASVSFEKQ